MNFGRIDYMALGAEVGHLHFWCFRLLRKYLLETLRDFLNGFGMSSIKLLTTLIGL